MTRRLGEADPTRARALIGRAQARSRAWERVRAVPPVRRQLQVVDVVVFADGPPDDPGVILSGRLSYDEAAALHAQLGQALDDLEKVR